MSRIHTCRLGRITQIALLTAPLLTVAVCGCSSPARSAASGTHHGGSITAAPQPSTSTTPPQPDPSPSPPAGTPVCDDLTEIAADLNTLQFGPSDNEQQELQSIGSLLSTVTGENPEQSSDLGALSQDYNTTVTNSGDGSDEDQGAILAGISNMDDDFNALEASCPAS
jgi:hypothetical protein